MDVGGANGDESLIEKHKIIVNFYSLINDCITINALAWHIGCGNNNYNFNWYGVLYVMNHFFIFYFLNFQIVSLKYHKKGKAGISEYTKV